jgi:hypothetical protein
MLSETLAFPKFKPDGLQALYKIDPLGLVSGGLSRATDKANSDGFDLYHQCFRVLLAASLLG